jgi:hypothetical protein
MQALSTCSTTRRLLEVHGSNHVPSVLKAMRRTRIRPLSSQHELFFETLLLVDVAQHRQPSRPPCLQRLERGCPLGQALGLPD